MISLFNSILIGQNISSIKFVYGLEGTYLPISAQCNPESFNSNFGDDINFSTTHDVLFIEKFFELFENLIPSHGEDYIDPRIMCIINYVDGNLNDTLCLGEFHGLALNGVLMQHDIEILNLIKDKIGWKSQVVGNTELDLKIKKMQQLYSSELLLEAIDRVATECFQDSCFGDSFFKNVNSLLYRVQNSKNGPVLINQINIWCETYIQINAYTDHIKEVLLEISQIRVDLPFVDDWLKEEHKCDSSEKEIQALQHKLTDYLFSLSDYERISFMESLINESKKTLKEEDTD